MNFNLFLMVKPEANKTLTNREDLGKLVGRVLRNIISFTYKVSLISGSPEIYMYCQLVKLIKHRIMNLGVIKLVEYIALLPLYMTYEFHNVFHLVHISL